MSLEKIPEPKIYRFFVDKDTYNSIKYGRQEYDVRHDLYIQENERRSDIIDVGDKIDYSFDEHESGSIVRKQVAAKKTFTNFEELLQKVGDKVYPGQDHNKLLRNWREVEKISKKEEEKFGLVVFKLE